MSWVMPLDLQYWFMNTLAETLDIFIFLAFIGVAILSARFKMPNYIFLTMFALLVVILNYFYEGLGGIYFLVIFLVGLLIFYSFAKIWE